MGVSQPEVLLVALPPPFAPSGEGSAVKFWIYSARRNSKFCKLRHEPLLTNARFLSHFRSWQGYLYLQRCFFYYCCFSYSQTTSIFQDVSRNRPVTFGFSARHVICFPSSSVVGTKLSSERVVLFSISSCSGVTGVKENGKKEEERHQNASKKNIANVKFARGHSMRG